MVKKNFQKGIVIAIIIILSTFSVFIAGIYMSERNLIEKDAEAKITKAYEYPIVPGMEEWEQLDTHVKKLNACQIPQDILDNLTTEALVETVMNFPLLIDILAYNTPEAGYQALYNEFNGIRELQERSDAIHCLNQYMDRINSLSVSDEGIEDDMVLHLLYAERIVTGINLSSSEMSEAR